MQADYRGQTDIFDPRSFTWPVHIIGMGGIGSVLFFELTKLGVSTVHIWDHDDVEAHNIPCQIIYRPSDIGLSKVEAACAFAERQELECTVIPHDEFVTADTPLEGIVISGVDSIDTRKIIWENIKGASYLVPLYMDGRIGGEMLRLLTLNPSDYDAAKAYEQWLFPAENAAELPCAARTVIHPPAVLAGLMVANLTLYAREEMPKANIVASLKHMHFDVN